MQAPSSPPQLAAVAHVFARLQHRTVVVPELLNALGSQVGGCWLAAGRLGLCMLCLNIMRTASKQRFQPVASCAAA